LFPKQNTPKGEGYFALFIEIFRGVVRKMAKLTPRQEKFVQGLFTGLTQRKAYKEAYNCEHWLDKTVDERACVLAKNDKINTRLLELQNEIKERNMVTVERILAEYAKIGFSDIKDFLEYRTEKTQLDEVEVDENGKTTMYKYKIVVEAKDSKDIDGTVVSEISLSKDGTFKFKLHDKLNALEKMGKTLGMFTEKIEHSGKLEMPDIIIGK